MADQKSILFIYLSIQIILHAYSKDTYFELKSNCNEFSQLSFQSDDSGYAIKNLNNGTVMFYDLKTSNPILEINNEDTMSFFQPVSADTPNLDFLMSFDDSRITIDGTDQWTMFIFEDFQGTASGWSHEIFNTCGNTMNLFLGGHCNFAKTEVSKTYRDLPQHDQIRITGNFHFFDDWHGEEGYMFVDDKLVWFDSYDWCDSFLTMSCKEKAINACGGDLPDRMSVPIDITIPHSSENISIKFKSEIDKSSCEASWGVDDLTIYLK